MTITWITCKNVDAAGQTERQIAAHRRRKVRPDGLCNKCFYAERAKTARKARGHRVKQRYGLTTDEHDALFRAQGGRCPCGMRITLLSPVDHDHSNGRVRGLMDDRCNRFLGHVKDRPQALLNLYVHLVRPIAQVGPVTNDGTWPTSLGNHPFTTLPGLFQCTWGLIDAPVLCGRLEHEHTS
jgi:hypothetical protein